jgi:hypothetical protein
MEKNGNGLYFLLQVKRMSRDSYSIRLLGKIYESSTTWGPKTVRISLYIRNLKMEIELFSNML